MLFSSITFIFIFLPATIALNLIVPEHFRNVILLVASLFFYAWGEPVYVILMILSIFLNYFCGKEIFENLGEKARAKRSLIWALAANLLLLGFFKYCGFFIEIVNAVLPVNISYRELGLPIGISFYTFQAISYLIDVYRGEVKPQKNILNFALYISMFPQLIAGPIVRYIDIEEQLRHRKMSPAKFGAGVRFFIIGLSKKVILANGMGKIFEEIYGAFSGGTSLYLLTAWIGAAAYALQIYFDFSGYSDMAIGLGKMFGFELKKNFDYPYTANSITDFWRRWHISLSTWFREYVYIPLGGNRVSKERHIFNLLVVWTLTGFWHGAAWNFMFWGFYYGIFLILEKYIWGKWIEKMPGTIRHLYALVVVLVGWVFFFSTGLQEAFRYLGMMIGIGTKGFAGAVTVFTLTSHWLLWVAGIFGSTRLPIRLLNRFGYEASSKWITDGLYLFLFLISISCLITDSFNPFLYFRF